jgi:hypothetical protein
MVDDGFANLIKIYFLQGLSVQSYLEACSTFGSNARTDFLCIAFTIQEQKVFEGKGKLEKV